MNVLDRVASSAWARTAGQTARQTVALISARAPWLNVERIAALVILLLALYFFLVSVSYGLHDEAQAAPGTFPALTAGALVVLSAIWLFTGKSIKKDADDETLVEDVLERYAHDDAVGREELPAAEPPGPDPTHSMESDSHPVRLLFVIVWSAITLPFIDLLGMVPVLFIYLTGLFVVVAQLTWWKVAIFTALTLLLVAYGAYAGGIYLPDPIGIGPFLFGTVARMFGG